MKRIFSFLLAILIFCSLFAGVFAEASAEPISGGLDLQVDPELVGQSTGEILVGRVDVDSEGHEVVYSLSDGAAVQIGDTLEYEIRYFNGKTTPAMVNVFTIIDNGLELDTETIGQGGTYADNTGMVSWTVTDVQPASYGSLTFRAKVKEESGPSVCLQATVMFDADISMETKPVEHPVSHILANPLDGASVKTGDVVTYTICYKNTGEDETSVTITDTLPAGLTYLDGSAVGASFDSGSNTVRWVLTNVPSGQEGAVALSATVSEYVPETVVNMASVGYGDTPARETEYITYHCTAVAPTPEPTTVPETGSLQVTLSVVGDGDMTKQWAVTVSLSEPVTGLYGDLQFRDGKSSFTMADGDVKTATALPAGATYAVNLTESNQGGYMTTAYGATGVIPANNVAAASITHELPHHDATPVLSESTPGAGVTVKAGDSITYSVTYFNDLTVPATVTVTAYLNGALKFYSSSAGGNYSSASDSVTWTISDVPARSGGTIQMVAQVASNATGSVNMSAQVAVTGGQSRTSNTVSNPIQKTGSLHIINQVAGASADASRQFQYSVQFGSTLNGQFGDVALVNGVGTFALANGQSRTISNIPEGTYYSVTQTDANANGYATTSTNATGNVSSATMMQASFTNVMNTAPASATPGTGTLTVTNTVTGDGDVSKDWAFVVTVNPVISGTYGQMTFVNGQASFSLRSGTTMMASSLPNGSVYFVKETDANGNGYKTTATNANGTIATGATSAVYFINNLAVTPSPIPSATPFASPTVSPSASPDMPLSSSSPDGTTGESGTDDLQPVTGKGNLFVTASVSDTGDKEKEWSFKVILDPAVNGRFGDKTFADGITEFTLKDGYTIHLNDIPAGTSYKVLETNSNADNYATSADYPIGTIKANTDVTVRFVNKLKMDVDVTPEPTAEPAEEPVEEEGSGHVWIWVLLGLLCLAGIGSLTYLYFKNGKSFDFLREWFDKTFKKEKPSDIADEFQKKDK